jgi:hypothetical protein
MRDAHDTVRYGLDDAAAPALNDKVGIGRDDVIFRIVFFCKPEDPGKARYPAPGCSVWDSHDMSLFNLHDILLHPNMSSFPKALKPLICNDKLFFMAIVWT